MQFYRNKGLPEENITFCYPLDSHCFPLPTSHCPQDPHHPNTTTTLSTPHPPTTTSPHQHPKRGVSFSLKLHSEYLRYISV